MKRIGVITKPGQFPPCVELLKTAAVVVLDCHEDQVGYFIYLCGLF
jgi:hypothetical protein